MFTGTRVSRMAELGVTIEGMSSRVKLAGTKKDVSLFMKRQVLLYGFVGGIFITLLKWTEYRFLILEPAGEVYGALIAAIFAALGIWLGLRLKGPRAASASAEIPTGLTSKRSDLGMTLRELEILELIALGMSNQEIADKLFVSPNTVKTHASRLFEKLGAKRRTHAVQLGKKLGLLP